MPTETVETEGELDLRGWAPGTRFRAEYRSDRSEKETVFEVYKHRSDKKIGTLRAAWHGVALSQVWRALIQVTQVEDTEFLEEPGFDGITWQEAQEVIDVEDFAQETKST